MKKKVSLNSLLNLILWLAVFISIFIVSTNSISDADFWWHLKTGEYIWQTKSVPHTDTFSHTASGREWTVHEWLAEVILYLVYKLSGFNGIVYFTALMAVFTFFVIALVLGRRGVPDLISQIVIFLGAIVVSPFFIPRPQLFYFLFWVVLIFFLTLYEEERKWVIFLIPFLFLVWANFHASIQLPILLIGLYLTSKLFSVFLFGEGKGSFLKKHQNLILTTSIGVLLAGVNPNGFRVYTYIFKGIPFLKKGSFEITEWGSLFSDPTAWQAWFFIGFYLLVLLTFLVVLKIGRYLRIIEWAMVVFPLIIAGLLVSKFLPTSLLLALPFLGMNMVEVFKIKKTSFDTRPILSLGVVSILLALSISYHYILGRPIREAWHNFPEKAAQFILQERIDGQMYNPYNWGGFLIWWLYPGYKTFIDGRFEMFEPDITADFDTIQEGKKTWREVLEKYKINFLILPPADVHPELAPSPSWTMVYFDNLAAIFVKNTPENSKIIEKLGYHIRPFLPNLDIEKGREQEAILEYERALKLNPDVFKAHYDLGILYLAQENYQKAEEHFQEAIKIFPKSANSHYNLAFSLGKQGKIEEAEKEYLEYKFLVK